MSIATVFVIPYRDRKEHKRLLLESFRSNLSDWPENSYRLLFIHQCDARPFNRGAMKNIGFLVLKELYPDCYSNITIIFHDVDTWPSKKGLIDYRTKAGEVKHYHGTRDSLGGIVAIKAGDFEKTGGFPNVWGWGVEDSTLYNRCLLAGLTINRDMFYELHDNIHIVRAFDGMTRTYTLEDPIDYVSGKLDSLLNITKLSYKIDGDLVNVTSFDVPVLADNRSYITADLRDMKGKLPIKKILGGRSWNLF